MEAKVGLDREVKRGVEADSWSQSVQILPAVLCSGISEEGDCSSLSCPEVRQRQYCLLQNQDLERVSFTVANTFGCARNALRA